RIQDAEVGLLQIANNPAVLGTNRHADRNQLDTRLECGLRFRRAAGRVDLGGEQFGRRQDSDYENRQSPHAPRFLSMRLPAQVILMDEWLTGPAPLARPQTAALNM